MMDLDEFIYETIDNSGTVGWLGDVVKRFEALTGHGPRALYPVGGHYWTWEEVREPGAAAG